MIKLIPFLSDLLRPTPHGARGLAQDAYLKDPHAVMIAYGLTPAQQTAVLSKDANQIAAQVAAELLSIPSPIQTNW